jgi:formylglycine-generating enzyme required for sulfatase activity
MTTKTLIPMLLATFLLVWGCDSENPGDYTSPHIGKLKYVPSGTFQRDTDPANLSTVSAFRMSEFEITRAQWYAVTGWADPSDTSYSSGTSDPVQRVNRYHAIAFCNKLSLLEGLTPVYTVSGVDFSILTFEQVPTVREVKWDVATVDWDADGYRLPTEMEWMWAAMDADTANPGAVNITGFTKAFAGSNGSNLIGDYAVFGYNTTETGHTTMAMTNQVGSKHPNKLGLYDLSGNVREWTWDWFGAYPVGPVTDYWGRSGESPFVRGGAWLTPSHYCSPAYRDTHYTYGSVSSIGFRVVRP